MAVIRCPNCNEENPDRFRLCGYCGTALQQAAPPEEVRKTVTIVFCDLKGSTSLGERLDSEALREVLGVYFDAMKAVLERHGGTVEKYIGDAIMAVFGLPRMHEDDALRAVRAAAEMRDALEEVNERLESTYGVRLQNRTGVNTGEVVAGDAATGQRLATGDTVNVAARLEQAAPECQVLLGQSTYRLVRDAVSVEEMEPLELKGKSERVPAYRLDSVSGGEAITRRVDLPMVGREGELSLILDAFDAAVDDSSPRTVTLLAQAGVGKSRLIAEVIRRLSERATVLRGRCLSYGEGATFWPVTEIVRQAVEAHGGSGQDAEEGLYSLLGFERQDIAGRIASLLGPSERTYPKDELIWAVGGFLEHLARERPLLVVFDDIHWAEPTFLDLVERLAAGPAKMPLLLLLAARHELLEERPEWSQNASRATTVQLSELSREESAVVARNLLGQASIPSKVEQRILTVAGGNPLFVEQTLSMLVDQDLLRPGEGGLRFVGGDEAISVPANISSLLAARLDRLSAAELNLLQLASVVGTEFETGILEALSLAEQKEAAGAPPGSLDPLLARLCDKHLLRATRPGLHGTGYEFSHVLVRDSAYERLLKRNRARLHEQLAAFLYDAARARIVEIEEILGYHLEQAFLYRAQLGPVHDELRELGERASGHLSSAGSRALSRGDMPAAAGLLQRAAELLGEEDSRRPRLLIDASDALIEIGEFARADSALTTAEERAAALGDESASTAAGLCLLQLHFMTEAREAGEGAVEELEARIGELEARGDSFSLVRAWRLLAYIHGTASRFGAAARAAEQTIRYASEAGNESMGRRSLGLLANSALYGPSPVSEAVDLCNTVIARAANDRKSTALTELMLGHLEAMRGEFQRARLLCQSSRAVLEQTGWKMLAALTSLDSAVVEVLAGDLAAAERELKQDFLTLEEMGERNYISTTAALLADVLYREGSFAEAERYLKVCEEIASADDIASQFLWRCVRGKLLAHEGKGAEAEAMLAEALELIRRSDQLDWQGNGLMDLAEVHRLGGDREAAARCAGEAGVLFGRKGNLVSEERARALVEEVRATGAFTG